jgi:hypothetical protein
LSVPALGPFPREGEYEHCFTLEGPRGEFVPLASSVVEWLARAIEYSRGIPAARKRRALAEREERADREYEQWAWELLDDAVPAFHSQPFVVKP